MSQLFLWISQFFQAIVEVSEIGTEAASPTTPSVLGSLPEPIVVYKMQVDRPFIFVVNHIPTQTMLYLCIVRNLK